MLAQLALKVLVESALVVLAQQTLTVLAEKDLEMLVERALVVPLEPQRACMREDGRILWSMMPKAAHLTGLLDTMMLRPVISPHRSLDAHANSTMKTVICLHRSLE